MSGADAPVPPFPGVSSPVEFPAPGMRAFGDEGPLHFTARALRARLQSVFPPARFDFQYLDGRLSKSQWTRLTRKPPAICLGFAGVQAKSLSPAFEGVSQWFVALVGKNESGPEQRLLGDRLAPGALAMVRAATIALQGFVIDPADTPWSASGAASIVAVTPLYSDDWIDDAVTLIGIELHVPYEETLPPDMDTPNHLDAIAATWTFPASPATPLFTTLTENVPA